MSNMKNATAENYIYNLLVDFFNAILPIIIAPYLAKTLGVENVGIYSYVHAFVTFISIFAGLGINSYGRREIAMVKDDKHKANIVFSELMTLRVIISTIVIVLYVFFFLTVQEYFSLYAVMSFTILTVAFDVSWVYQANDNFKVFAVRNFIIKILTFIGVFLFVRSASSLFIYALMIELFQFIGTLWLLLGINKYVSYVSIKFKNVFTHLKGTLIFFVPTIATTVYTILDKVMLGSIYGNQFESGYYDQAQKIVSTVTGILISLNVVVGVQTSYLYAQKDFKQIVKKVEKSLNYVCFLGFPLCIGVYGVSEEVILLFWGNEYANSIPLIKVLSILIIIISISNCLGGQLLTPINMRKQSAIVICIGAVINLILNFILIPQYGAMGACIATVIAESFITGLYIFIAQTYICFKRIFGKIWRYPIACILVYIYIKFCACLEMSIVSVIIKIAGSILLYSLFLLITRDVFFKDCLNMVRQRIRRKKE